MPFLADINRAWSDFPPLRIAVASFLGFKPQQAPSKDFGSLLAMFPGGVIR